MKEEFDILAAKTLAGEASVAEPARLKQLVAQSAELDREFSELKAAWNSLREFTPLAESLKAPPASVPCEKLSRLQAAVRDKFSSATASEDHSTAQHNAPVRHARPVVSNMDGQPDRSGNARLGNEAKSGFA